MFLQTLAVALLAGSGLAAAGLPAWTSLAPALLCLQWWRRRWWRVGAMAILSAGLSLGAASWYQRHVPSRSSTDISHFVGDGPTRVRGVVEGDRDEREHSLVLHLRVSGVEGDDGLHTADGSLLLRVPLSAGYEDGDAIESKGKLVSPRDSAAFDYRGYLAREGIYAEADYPSTRLLPHDSVSGLKHNIFLLRSRLDSGIRSVLPEPEASLGAGMALGTRRITEPALSAELASTDAAMIALATGYNVTVVGMLTLSGLAWLIGRHQAAVAALIAMAAYALFLGPFPSVLRAAAMGSIAMASIVVGRPHAATRTLLLASAVMVALDPLALTSISFPLTLAATGGVIWLARPVSDAVRWMIGFGGEREGLPAWTRGVVDNLSMTLAAICPALPIIVATSHRLSLSSLPVNLVLFPLVPALTLLSAATAVAGAVWHPAALVLAPPAYLLLWSMKTVVHIGSRLPAAQLNLPWFNVPQALGLYAVAALSVWLTRRGTVWSGWWHEWLTAMRSYAMQAGREVRGADPPTPAVRSRAIVLVFGVGAVALLVPLAVARGSAGLAAIGAAGTDSNALRVTYLDVGPGSAMIVQSGSQRLLLNAGPPGDGTVRALDRVLPPWQRSINVVLMTDSVAGHSGGLVTVLRRYRVGAVMDAAAPTPVRQGSSPAASDWRAAVSAADVTQVPRAATSYVQLGTWQVIVESGHEPVHTAIESASRPLDETPATVIAQSGGLQLVLAGDTTAAIVAELRSVNRGNASRPPALPRIAVVEATQASPATGPESIPDLSGAFVYRTTENGDVTVDVSAAGMRVSVARGPRMGITSVK